MPAAETGGSASYATDESLTELASVEVPGTEPFRRADPVLPAVPPGPVKKFRIDVYEHVTKVSDDLPPTRVWSYAINGKFNRGNGVSAPIVVNQGDKVEMTLFNGSSEKMHVRVPHSIDFHSSELNPETAFKTIAPGKKTVLRFTATHAGVFMYHCATAPVLQHTGSGMVGMMVVKPRDLEPVDREFWINQQEFYLGKPGSDGNLEKMEAKTPDAITFNGYAAQYQNHPIKVRRGERIRVYVLNSGPSIWSAFHVIGTVFDRTLIEGTEGVDAQTVNLAPSQGGIVEFTLENEGRYTFVTHSFADAVKGAIGVFETENPPGGRGDGARQLRPRNRPGAGVGRGHERHDGRVLRRDRRERDRRRRGHRLGHQRGRSATRAARRARAGRPDGRGDLNRGDPEPGRDSRGDGRAPGRRLRILLQPARSLRIRSDDRGHGHRLTAAGGLLPTPPLGEGDGGHTAPSSRSTRGRRQPGESPPG